MVFHTEIRWLYRIALFICIFNITELYCLKISAPSVLLPYNKGLPTNYSVEITGAKPDNCFQWESAKPQIVQVIPIFTSPNCSRKAVISSRADLEDRKVTRISAILEGGSKKHFYIDVITNVVSQIELSWQTDELIQGGSPQVLTLIARDELGHIFTSINGLEVQWKISHHSEENEEFSEKEVIRLSRFDVSDYESPEENPWERRGLFSTSVLAVPLNVGTSKISASLLLTGKSVFETKEITLNVLPNAKIHPASSLRLLPHSSVNVRRENLLNGKLEEMDDEYFEPVIEDPEFITLSDFSLLSAKTYGNSVVNYKCKDDNKGCLDLSMKVYVEKLDHIGLRISRGGFKNLEEMKTYEVVLDLYDEKNNLMHATDNMLFSVNFPTKLFHVIFTSRNGTYSIVQSIVPGRGKIKAEYKGVLLQDGTISKDYIVNNSMDVTICQKLNIFPPQTLLPVLSHGKAFHAIPLTVTGGTGDYVWALSDYKTAKIIPSEDNKNAARLEVYGEIDLTVTVTDRLNKNFISTAKVSIQPPIDIEAYPTVVEAEVGNVLIIPTALLGYENKEKNIVRKFDDCSKIEPTVDIVEKYVLSHEKESQIPSFGKGCMSLQFRCKYSGHTRVNIEHTVKTGENSNVTYKTTTVLSCFKPLKPVQPVRVAVLALATAKEVAFEGGPRKWPLYKAGHYSELAASDPDKVKIELIKDPVRYNKDLTVFRVTCKALGENTLTFTIGNNPSATIQHPAKAEASIKFICAEPHSVHLKLYKKKTSKRQMDDNIVKVPFYGEKIFAVDIWVKDAMGRKFANISSLRVVWDVSDKTLAEPETHFDFMTHENAVAGYRKLSRDFKEFKMKSGTGDWTVSAKVTSYREEVLSAENIIDYTEIQEISKSIDLKLVSLRDFNPGGFETVKKNLEEDGYCEKDSCKN